MFLVAIGVCDNAEIIKADIYRQLDEAKKDGIDVVIDDYYAGDALFVRCGIRDKLLNILTEKKAYEELKYTLSKALTEVIISHYELKLLRKLAKANFFYLSERERASVIGNALKLLKEEKMMQPGGFYKATRRSRIMRSILEYLDVENEINIEGFVNFRLNAYINELNETIERALEIFVAEREYNEFIKLLRYFVEIQECKIDTIHLCQSKDGRYIMYDESRNRVSSEYFDELRSEMLDESINYDDLLISTLITISPNKIIIHDMESFKNKELLQTIMNVFAERITVCNKCDLCSSQAEGKETNKYSL
ncbi:MAG TPA: putative sporulation protein YtxC [Clostridia bacterium]|nr:putative sporulation protein YtxC [Clostridia bacterium]